jgi:hypothetical protein
MRLRLDGDASSEASAALADSLARIPGVRHVVVRPDTGSVIPPFDQPPARCAPRLPPRERRGW